MILTYETLPTHDNINPYAYCVEVRNQMFLQKGKMIAYFGQLRFEALGAGPFDMIVQQAFNAPAFAQQFIIGHGQGKLILGDRGNNIASYDLTDGALTIKAQNLLAFDPTLFCQESTLPGYLSVQGTGKFLASSNGPVHFMEPPVRVDEQALLGWADVPSPSYRYDYAHVRNVIGMVGTFLGITLSGEEKQVDFTGQGTVLVQSSEEGLIGHDAAATILHQAGRLDKTELGQVVQRLSAMMRQ